MTPTNRLLLTDSYKVSHWKQYPPGTQHVYSYWESRGGWFPELVFFGLQAMLRKYLSTPIEHWEIEQAKGVCGRHFMREDLFNHEGWYHILTEHGGKLPVRIKAVPEGTVVPIRNVMMTIENTCPECFWVTNYLETLLCQLWYPTTVATLSREIKKVINRYKEETGGQEDSEFKLHDFGFRGVSSVESAEIGGAAHLISFRGTDNMTALKFVSDYYGGQLGMAGFSIPAAEHSTITSWGQENEIDAFRNMIQQFGGHGTQETGLYAVVSDSWNIFEACKVWGNELLEMVREAPNMLVVRPDSGTPHVVVVQVIETLDDSGLGGFGHTVNERGYKVLNGVRVIQGDGVDYDEIGRILEALKIRGWSSDNIAFGMGGALLQKLNRDTQQFAFKCSEVRGTYGDRDVWKEPVTDQGKRSKRGRLALVKDGNTLVTAKIDFLLDDDEDLDNDLLRTVFENGEIIGHDNFQDIQDRAEA